MFGVYFIKVDNLTMCPDSNISDVISHCLYYQTRAGYSHMSVVIDIFMFRVTHICVGKLNIIGSDNGLSPGRRQAII